MNADDFDKHYSRKFFTLTGDECFQAIGLIDRPAIVFKNMETGAQDVRVVGSLHFKEMKRLVPDKS